MRKPNGYWTLERCLEEALKYKTRKEWEKKNASSYTIARKKGWLDQSCSHMREVKKAPNHWTLERCQEEALKYTTRYEWTSEHTASYSRAHKNGWLDQCCSHMTEIIKPKRYWTLERCKEEALKYNTRNEWRKKHNNSYSAASAKGLVDQCCSHMADGLGSDRDVVYVWQAEGQYYNGEKVYKIGITSARLGNQRVEQVAKTNDMQAKLIVLQYVGRYYTPTLEQHLLAFGEDPKLDATDGSTEFRALTDEQLQTIIAIIKAHPIQL